MVPGSLAAQDQRTRRSVPQRAGGEREGLHFAHQGNSQAHGGFVVATADAAFGAVAAAVASFVAAAHAVFVAAAAVAAHVVGAEGFVAAAFVAGLDVAVVFVLASAAVVNDVGILHSVPSSLGG